MRLSTIGGCEVDAWFAFYVELKGMDSGAGGLFQSSLSCFATDPTYVSA